MWASTFSGGFPAKFGFTLRNMTAWSFVTGESTVLLSEHRFPLSDSPEPDDLRDTLSHNFNDRVRHPITPTAFLVDS
jgi:hypothetical protein